MEAPIVADSTLLLLALLVPLAGGVLLTLQSDSPNTRDVISLVTGTLLFVIVLALYPAVLSGDTPSITLAEPIKGLSFTLEAEPLGLLFATIASGLWILTTLYGMGYMRGNCLLYTSPSPRDQRGSRMPSSA